MEPQENPGSQNNTEKEKEAGCIILPYFILYYKASIMRTV